MTAFLAWNIRLTVMLVVVIAVLHWSRTLPIRQVRICLLLAVGGLFLPAFLPPLLDRPWPLAHLPEAMAATAVDGLGTALPRWLLAGYLLGLVALAAVVVVRNAAWYRRISRLPAVGLGITIDRPLPTALQVRGSDVPGSPFVFGVSRPILVLPVDWCVWPVETRRAAIEHELAHLELRDGWLVSLQWLARVVYWYHPLVWLITARLDRVREAACDDLAAERVGMSRMEYATTLLTMANLVRADRSRPVGALAALSAAARQLAFRIDALAARRPPRRWHLAHATVIGLAIVAVRLVGPDARSPVAGPLLASAVPVDGFDTIARDHELRSVELAVEGATPEGRVIVDVAVSPTGAVDRVDHLGGGCAAAATLVTGVLAATRWIPASHQGERIASTVRLAVLR